MQFALIGDYQYRECMELNISQIRKFHPESEIYIGNLGGNNIDGCQNIDLSGQTERECFMMMKPLFMLTVMSYAKEVVLMDGDMVLIKPMDLTETTVTVRDSKHGRINSGLVVSDNSLFVAKWLSNVIKLFNDNKLYIGREEVLCEQNALIETVKEFKVNEVPCDVYNYPKVESGIPDSVKVVHLKSGRFKKPELMQIVRCNI